MNARASLVGLLLLLAIVPSADAGWGADPCATYGPAVGLVAVGPLYVEDRGIVHSRATGAWENEGGLYVYVETNGIEGLQRGGQDLFVGLMPDSGEHDACGEWDEVPNDTLLFCDGCSYYP